METFRLISGFNHVARGLQARVPRKRGSQPIKAMKHLWIAMLAGILATGCAYDVTDPVVGVFERMGKPPAEQEWNSTGVWYQVAVAPPVYLPKGYEADRPRTEQAGIWVVDQRDGKRLFVPFNGANGLTYAVLRAEAAKVTNWRPRRGEVVPVQIVPPF